MMYQVSTLLLDPNVRTEILAAFADPNGPFRSWPGEPTAAYPTMGHSLPMMNIECPFAWFQHTFDQVIQTITDMTGCQNVHVVRWWINCGSPGEEYRWHSNSTQWKTATLYIQIPENSGALQMRKDDEFETFYPAVGNFIIFDGKLVHRVMRNDSTDLRISVTFDCECRC